MHKRWLYYIDFRLVTAKNKLEHFLMNKIFNKLNENDKALEFFQIKIVISTVKEQ